MSKSGIFKIILLGCSALLFIYAIFRYLETPEDTHNVKTQVSLSSNELISLMSNKVDSSFYQYVDKAIEIESVIKEINKKEGVYTLLLSGDDKDTLIICEMQKNQNVHIQKLTIGDPIVVKGVFKGFLKDAVLLNCIIMP
ncbi:hypothetical protein ACFO3O_13380 [Dokdonia ponticola]|uniref:tRNA_anti-like n=1 Tax=Dokdonia ponticola TaxID=2041041 RepID=A0ABV9HZX4_9FLAO